MTPTIADPEAALEQLEAQFLRGSLSFGPSLPAPYVDDAEPDRVAAERPRTTNMPTVGKGCCR